MRGLAAQIAREVDCEFPSALVKFNQTETIRFVSNAVLPFMHGGAKQDLVAVSQNHTLRVTSGYRTLPQQYLLYRWSRLGRCGIAIAALPGSSNHESGRAVDLSNWSSLVGAMANHHWAHDVPGDPVHFDHLSSPDNRGKDVRAFQRLWNRNHPGDKISADGDYGRATAARLRRSPAKGFSKGPSCGTSALTIADTPELEVLSIDGPDRVAPASDVHYTVTVANPEDADWPDTVRLVVADGTASPMYDADTWLSPTEVGPISVVVPAHGDAELDIQLAAAEVAEETPVSTTFALVDGTRLLGTFDLAFTVTPGGGEGSLEDGADEEQDDGVADEDGVVDGGGCASTRGSSAWLLLALLALRRRRRRQ